jgi:hypothetical protein
MDTLKNSFYRYGVEANVDLKIEVTYMGSTNTWQYYTWYQGKVDFSTYKDQLEWVEVNLLEGGLSALIKANEDKKYSIGYDLNTPGFKRFALSVGTTADYTGITFKSLFTLLIDKVTNGGITDNTYAVKSDYLDGLDILPDSTFVVLSAKHFRLCPSAVLKTSLSDFFKSINAQGNIGIGIETINGKETVVLEEKSYWFSTDAIATFNKAKNIKISPAKEFIYNSIKGGYEDHSYDYAAIVNGGFEISTFLNFDLDIQSIKKEYDIQPVYRADWSGMYMASITNVADETYDYGEDDDIFMVELTTPFGIVYNTIRVGWVMQGTTTQEWKNINLSPHRNLVRHSKFINSFCYNIYDLGTTHIPYLSAGKNEAINETSTQMISGFISEVANLVISNAVADMLFKPYIIEFDTPVLEDMATLMQTLGKGVVTVNYDDVVLKGFVMDIGSSPIDSKDMTVKILCSPDTDLTLLL